MSEESVAYNAPYFVQSRGRTCTMTSSACGIPMIRLCGGSGHQGAGAPPTGVISKRWRNKIADIFNSYIATYLPLHY